MESNNPNDVLYLKGTAAQTTTNPGNLLFYRLCEEHYEEYMAFDPKRDKQLRKDILTEIVTAIQDAGGGQFRTKSGDVMEHKDAIIKTRDRMRQINKPKVRPTGNFGPNDVVSGVKGSAVHLYPGNAKWHNLLEEHASSYYRDIINSNGEYDEEAWKQSPTRRNEFRDIDSRGRKLKHCVEKGVDGNYRPSYQNDIVDQTITIIHDRGGKFLNEQFAELTHEEAVMKTHFRFRALKKMLIAGTRKFVPYEHDNDNSSGVDVSHSGDDLAAEGNNIANDASTPTTTPSKIIQNRSGGFTSVKSVVGSSEKLRASAQKRKIERANIALQKKRKNEKKNTPTPTRTPPTRSCQRRNHSDGEGEDDRDELSFDSSVDSSDDDDSESGDDDDSESSDGDDSESSDGDESSQ